jgi:hypothetical protein
LLYKKKEQERRRMQLTPGTTNTVSYLALGRRNSIFTTQMAGWHRPRIQIGTTTGGQTGRGERERESEKEGRKEKKVSLDRKISRRQGEKREDGSEEQ